MSLSEPSKPLPTGQNNLRCHIELRGMVQGVGFRPFVYRLAQEMRLSGWVTNSPQGVVIEAEGNREVLDTFQQRLLAEKPPNSLIQSHESTLLDYTGFDRFTIRGSDGQGSKTTWILPDLATCPECLMDICDPNNRRYLYPFTNCTCCGPRFSIVHSLPYDRPNTTMREFEMCEACRAEYHEPANRRFHAQPNACPTCGPQLALWDTNGKTLSARGDALFAVADAIREGKIVAVKGLGGFHLMVDAQNDEAVQRLRQRKQREEKPFALMSPNPLAVQEICRVSEEEHQLLRSPQAPIVLLERNEAGWNSQKIAESVAPNNPYLGMMLPYTPLHHILLSELGFSIVATSGNLSDEPICTEEHEALQRLSTIADLFLMHNRPIARHVDDSIVRHVLGHTMILRRARGYAPHPIVLDAPMPSTLAVGGHLKNTVALSRGSHVFISQHIGDLETKESSDAFEEVIDAFQRTYETQPERIACDLHPDYRSTHFAKTQTPEPHAVQHHYAHVLSCMADNGLDSPVLGISWDGTGYGTDGTIWGGEFLYCTRSKFERLAYIQPFPLPGGEKAIKDIRLCAVGLLYAIYGENEFESKCKRYIPSLKDNEWKTIAQLLSKNIHCPLTSSVGRLFDATASLLDIRQRVSFEGQAAMELEWLIGGTRTKDSYPYRIVSGKDDFRIDMRPMFDDMLNDQDEGVSKPLSAARFHNTLVSWIVEIARRAGQKQVVLTGGCFQNIYLLQRAVHCLESEGFTPYWHKQVPTNDGGLCLGQIIGAAYGDPSCV